MKTFIPREKLSKKAKRALNQKQRQTWAINPVSRKSMPFKAYDRKRSRNWPEDGGFGSGSIERDIITD